jgi:hypothetical protein
MISWAARLGLTALGAGYSVGSETLELLKKSDASLSDRGTHLLFHYKLSSNEDAEVWHDLTNLFLPSHREFTREDALEFLVRRGYKRKTRDGREAPRGRDDKQLHSDLGIYLKSLTDSSSLGDLGLLKIVRAANGKARSMRYRTGSAEELPPLLLCHILYTERDRCRPGASTWNIPDLLAAEGNVGRVFGLTEERFLSHVGRLQERRLLTLTRHADLYQIGFPSQGQPTEILKMYYEERHR